MGLLAAVRRRGPAAAAVAAVLAVAFAPPALAAGDPGTDSGKRRALIAFVPTEPLPRLPLLFDLEQRGLPVALTSPTLGGYAKRQMVLDISQGARIPTRIYDEDLPPLELVSAGRGGRIAFWDDAVRRADRESDEIVPGLLAETVRRAGGTVGYVGVAAGDRLDGTATRDGEQLVDVRPPEAEHLEAVVAADRSGRIPAVSLGSSATFADRLERTLEGSSLVVARFPEGNEGLRALDRLLAARTSMRGELVYVLRAPPWGGLRLLPTALARGGDFPPGLTSLRSDTSRRPGLLAATDAAPTVLAWLGLDEPDEMQGRPIEAAEGPTAEELRKLSDRFNVVIERRSRTVTWGLWAWLALLAALAAAGGRAGLRAGLRIGFLGVLWLPGLALASGAPWLPEVGGRLPLLSAPAEALILGLGSLALGAATDRFVRWPAGPLVPAAAVCAAHAIDLALGSPLITTSLAGPNPRGGARFFGIGNELEIILAVTLLIGVGAATARSFRAPAAFAGAALAGALVMGAGRLGADVGGVITLAVGGAVAVLASLPGGPSRRAIAVAVATPVLAVAGLVVIDLVTGGDAHLTRSVLDAENPGDLLEVVERRFEIATSGLDSGTRPISVSVAVLLLVLGTWRRRRLFAPLREQRGFAAGLAGALAATVAGALSNDSGPGMLLVGTVLLALATAYVRGRPLDEPQPV